VRAPRHVGEKGADSVESTGDRDAAMVAVQQKSTSATATRIVNSAGQSSSIEQRRVSATAEPK
jgi:hypothetical protein